jgi:hypothetical protein
LLLEVDGVHSYGSRPDLRLSTPSAVITPTGAFRRDPRRRTCKPQPLAALRPALCCRARDGVLENTHVKGGAVTKDHGSSVKNDKQYEGLRKKGMSKSRAAAISNASGSSSKGGNNSSKKKGSGGKKSS